MLISALRCYSLRFVLAVLAAALLVGAALPTGARAARSEITFTIENQTDLSLLALRERSFSPRRFGTHGKFSLKRASGELDLKPHETKVVTVSGDGDGLYADIQYVVLGGFDRSAMPKDINPMLFDRLGEVVTVHAAVNWSDAYTKKWFKKLREDEVGDEYPNSVWVTQGSSRRWQAITSGWSCLLPPGQMSARVVIRDVPGLPSPAPAPAHAPMKRFEPTFHCRATISLLVENSTDRVLTPAIAQVGSPRSYGRWEGDQKPKDLIPGESGWIRGVAEPYHTELAVILNYRDAQRERDSIMLRAFFDWNLPGVSWPMNHLPLAPITSSPDGVTKTLTGDLDAVISWEGVANNHIVGRAKIIDLRQRESDAVAARNATEPRLSKSEDEQSPTDSMDSLSSIGGPVADVNAG